MASDNPERRFQAGVAVRGTVIAGDPQYCSTRDAAAKEAAEIGPDCIVYELTPATHIDALRRLADAVGAERKSAEGLTGLQLSGKVISYLEAVRSTYDAYDALPTHLKETP